MGLDKYQKDCFTSSTVTFYQKSNFDFLTPFRYISGYLNLWEIFRFIFRQLMMTFFHKIVAAEKNNFPSNAEHNFVKIRVISKCKNDKP